MKDSDVNYTGIARWSWYLLEGELGHRSHVITSYIPCGNVSCGCGESIVYQQQLWYIQEKVHFP